MFLLWHSCNKKSCKTGIINCVIIKSLPKGEHVENLNNSCYAMIPPVLGYQKVPNSWAEKYSNTLNYSQYQWLYSCNPQLLEIISGTCYKVRQIFVNFLNVLSSLYAIVYYT